MKMEIGKQYITRNGKLATIVAKTREEDYWDFEDFPFKGFVSGQHDAEVWRNNGSYTDDPANKHDLDLVERIP